MSTWVLNIRSPWHEPREFILPAGKVTLGRKPDNDIVIADESASRLHAEIEYDTAAGAFTVRDMGSTNGTYLNRERLDSPQALKTEDQIRIGQHTLTVSRRERPDGKTTTARLPGTQPLTRDLVLEAVDQHAVVLYEVAMRLNTIIDLETALKEVSNLARTAMGADRCEVIPANRFDRLSESGFPISLAYQAIDQRAVVFIPDLSSEFDTAVGQSTLMLHIRSVLCVPGIAGDEVAALTYAYRTNPTSRPFDQQDVQLAIAISHQAALTIQRSLLLEKAQRLDLLTMNDTLTGLNNRRHFLELADKEFQRARRYKRPLATMMLNIDRFKQLNDTYGHAVGDQVLRGVATRCSESVREANLLARYGGDEFIVLLLECDLSAAERVATRLHRRMAAAPIETDAGPLSIGISTGCAALVEDCANLQSLIALTDAALYLAKRPPPNAAVPPANPAPEPPSPLASP
jgi:diguanylate cyclase (GGDEF)-like protein